MSEHTKEPWIFDAPDADFSGIIIGRHGGEVVDGEFTEANARRIVACVNACAGMDDPEKEIAALRAENEAYEKTLLHLMEKFPEVKAVINAVGKRSGE